MGSIVLGAIGMDIKKHTARVTQQLGVRSWHVERAKSSTRNEGESECLLYGNNEKSDSELESQENDEEKKVWGNLPV